MSDFITVSSHQSSVGSLQLAVFSWQSSVVSHQLAVTSWQSPVGSLQLAVLPASVETMAGVSVQ